MDNIRCSRCRANLPSNAPEGLCPACLLSAAMDPVSLVAGDPAESPIGGRSAGAADYEPRLKQDQQFGPYRIERLLGRGGMGEMYEAVHLEQSRRVALKVLGQRLRRADDRARFIQEGQLAASVNHPNSVYVFGSEEIDGVPVIAMELLSGGTLKDRVKVEGPLPASEAVNAILQVIAGLDAAHAAGVLHRDVKPSNCFADYDGTVKIGDFGLSISSSPRRLISLASSNSFEGTPEFASPEQRRGDALDVRADIYSVGATLYYLLTGKPPLDPEGTDSRAGGADLEGPRPLRNPQPAIPAGLDDVVGRCLASHPDARYRSYEELTRDLESLRSVTIAPARLSLRVAAGLFDSVFLVSGLAVAMAILVGAGLIRSAGLALTFGCLLPSILYWGFSEGLSGTSIGKRSCRLRVVSTHGGQPSISQALVRSSIFLMPAALMISFGMAASRAWQSSSAFWLTEVALLAGAIGLLFSSARRKNGFAGLHELLTGTRVIGLANVEARRAPSPPSPPIDRDQKPVAQIKPYDVIEALGATEVGELFLGFDPRLKRRVWIHVVRSGTPAVSVAVRDRSRATALHWLNGQRAAFGGWDAYEALDGTALTSAASAQPWNRVSQWLLDLSLEFDARLENRSLSGLALDRVWITSAGHAKLLDFQAPGPAVPEPTKDLTLVSGQLFLHEVAVHALAGRMSPPLPLSASGFLRDLAGARFFTMHDVVDALKRLVTQPDRVTSKTRGMSLAVGLSASLACAPFVRAIAMHLSMVRPDVGYISCLVLALLSALVLRSGFWLYAFGIAVVTRDGLEVSRARAAIRALVAWSWVPLHIIAVAQGWWVMSVQVSVLTAAGLIGAALVPQRGLQDQLT